MEKEAARQVSRSTDLDECRALNQENQNRVLNPGNQKQRGGGRERAKTRKKWKAKVARACRLIFFEQVGGYAAIHRNIPQHATHNTLQHTTGVFPTNRCLVVALQDARVAVYSRTTKRETCLKFHGFVNLKYTLQHTATHCNTLQHTATHCNTLQHTSTHCNTLQHTATHARRECGNRTRIHIVSVLQCVAVCCRVRACVRIERWIDKRIDRCICTYICT